MSPLSETEKHVEESAPGLPKEINHIGLGKSPALKIFGARDSTWEREVPCVLARFLLFSEHLPTALLEARSWAGQAHALAERGCSYTPVCMSTYTKLHPHHELR